MFESPLKVWQLDPANITPYYNLAVCKALSEAGCKVEYFTSQYLYDEALPTSDRFNTTQLYFRGLNHRWLINHPRLRQTARGIAYPLGHLLFLTKLLKQRPDIVHIQWSRLPGLDYWLIKQLHRLNIPIVHTVHDIVPLFDKGNFKESLKRVYENSDRLIVHADANAEELMRIFPDIAQERVRTIPLIRFDNPILPKGANQQLARRHLQLPQNVPVFVFFGVIRESKGLDTLYDAFTHLLSEAPTAHLVVAGHANSQLEKTLLGRFMNHSNIHVYPGYASSDDIWKYHLAADVLVFPYRQIYQSAALITAMGFGRPVIVTNVGGMPETIDGNGWIVEPNDPLELSNVMLEALSDLTKLEQMGQRSLELIESRHGHAFIASQLITIYRELIEERRNTTSPIRS